MAFIQWTDAMCVGIAVIDRQHQSLVGMLNSLDDAMYEGRGKDVLDEIINGLIAYAMTHFRTEEAYFDQFDYPDAVAHKAEHAAFEERVGKFKAGFEAGTIGLSFEIMDFLSTWVQNHIQNADKKYGPFLKAHGLA